MVGLRMSDSRVCGSPTATTQFTTQPRCSALRTVRSIGRSKQHISSCGYAELNTIRMMIRSSQMLHVELKSTTERTKKSTRRQGRQTNSVVSRRIGIFRKMQPSVYTGFTCTASREPETGCKSAVGIHSVSRNTKSRNLK